MGKLCRGLALQSIIKGIKIVLMNDNITDGQILSIGCNKITRIKNVEINFAFENSSKIVTL
jgi:hypothetical protein